MTNFNIQYSIMRVLYTFCIIVLLCSCKGQIAEIKNCTEKVRNTYQSIKQVECTTKKALSLEEANTDVQITQQPNLKTLLWDSKMILW